MKTSRILNTAADDQCLFVQHCDLQKHFSYLDFISLSLQ